MTELVDALGWLTFLAPASLALLLGFGALLGRLPNERLAARLTEASILAGLSGSLGILSVMLLGGERHVEISLGDWIHLPGNSFHFEFLLVFDRLSVPFLILAQILVGTVGAFASRYLHRESGYQRFFLLYALFVLGIVMATLAGTIELLFCGWELVGLSSALLVAFFQEREVPVRNGLRVWTIYRLGDAAFLIAAIAFHHASGGGEITTMAGQESWPAAVDVLSPASAALVGTLLLMAVACKSALLPVSDWLPGAMEGPTPSSAIFYGALSVHLGSFLLLRVEPLIAGAPFCTPIIVTLGLVSALFGSIKASVQPDPKTALAWSSLTQVGIITAEIGFGLHYIALVHILGHASLRSLQLLRAPSLLQDTHNLENAIGGHLAHPPAAWETRLPSGVRIALYRFALDRRTLDRQLDRWIARPVLALARALDRVERAGARFLSGGAGGASER